jgi:16S rRNA (uracil1498-N3)-methyltransferase
VTEAAEQAHRGRVPALAELADFEQALENAGRAGGCMIIPWELEHTTGLGQILPGEGIIHLFIGPEGGFTPDEIALARSHGAIPITLGARTLRAETAGLVAASAILYARGDMDARR